MSPLAYAYGPSTFFHKKMKSAISAPRACAQGWLPPSPPFPLLRHWNLVYHTLIQCIDFGARRPCFYPQQKILLIRYVINFTGSIRSFLAKLKKKWTFAIITKLKKLCFCWIFWEECAILTFAFWNDVLHVLVIHSRWVMDLRTIIERFLEK